MCARLHPTTETIKSSEARQHFSEILNQVFRREKRVLVEKSGIPVAAIVTAQDLDELIELERVRTERFAVLDEIQARNRHADPSEAEMVVAEEIAAMRRERRSTQVSR
jgi:prevent-host-death family protein